MKVIMIIFVVVVATSIICQPITSIGEDTSGKINSGKSPPYSKAAIGCISGLLLGFIAPPVGIACCVIGAAVGWKFGSDKEEEDEKPTNKGDQ